ncbi:hypothetical protein INS49_015558 [Diaporthe citri]|uniref:uncharacterized protein n=1 Tax=Diaporthe citri TaxID=83186 RepID=UPI001C7E33ED|nr:uncharacterized protein INS49_015558 [Diaporthe citri]KAG6356171.1 hypothetical protein INS49_015558 [Diaporthe citri]
MSDDSTTARKTVVVGLDFTQTVVQHVACTQRAEQFQCDETKPTCENCVKFRIPCSFNSNPSPPSDVSPPAKDVPRRRGRPRKDWLAAAAQSSSDDHGPGNKPDHAAGSLGTPPEQPPPYLIGDHSLNITDLQLLHHYMPDWRGPVDRLRLHICSLMDPVGSDPLLIDVCRESLSALEQIRPACEAMWGKTPDEPLERDQESSVYAWLYRLGNEYIQCLQRKEQIALVVFGYFALLLKELEVFWFMEGWAEHIIMGIDQFLDEEHRTWLEWPKEQLGLTEITIKKYRESMVLT